MNHITAHVWEVIGPSPKPAADLIFFLSTARSLDPDRYDDLREVIPVASHRGTRAAILMVRETLLGLRYGLLGDVFRRLRTTAAYRRAAASTSPVEWELWQLLLVIARDAWHSQAPWTWAHATAPRGGGSPMEIAHSISALREAITVEIRDNTSPIPPPWTEELRDTQLEGDPEESGAASLVID